MTDHPITPPHELVQQWVSLAGELEGFETWQDLATQAARWGADMELDACCDWLEYADEEEKLRACRRPEPKSLKDQALEALDEEHADMKVQNYKLIRSVLESLTD